jgi:hypothetical protein
MIAADCRPNSGIFAVRYSNLNVNGKDLVDLLQ